MGIEEHPRIKMGIHIIVDIWGCDFKILDNLEAMEEIFDQAAKVSGMKIFGKLRKKFSPQGVSLVIGIEESHFTVHTSPEIEGYAAVDVFTCGDEGNADEAAESIVNALKEKSLDPSKVNFRKISFERGIW